MAKPIQYCKIKNNNNKNYIKFFLKKGGGSRDQITNIHWIIKKARIPEKHLFDNKKAAKERASPGNRW